MIALCALALAAAQLPPVSHAAQSAPTLQLSAPSLVEVGDSIMITLGVAGAANLAGYEATLLFDTRAAEFAGLSQRDNDVQKIGRGVGSLNVAELPYGTAIGMYSCPSASCVDGADPRQPGGAAGTIKLATIELIAQQPGTLEIALGAIKFVDAAGNALAVDTTSSRLAVQVGAAGAGPRYPAPAAPWRLAAAVSPAPAAALDITGDRKISHADLMELALDWTRAHERGAPCGALADPRHDANRDGCVDVADLQQVAASYSPASVLAPQAIQPSAALTFVVNSTGDQADSNIGDGICRTSSGTCTLRAAIYEANAHPGPDTIRFNISGTGVHTIQLSNNLPSLHDASGGTTIDGYSQAGAAPNTDPLVSNAEIKVQIAGRGPTGIDGLPITAAGNVVRGLSFYNFHRGIWIVGAGAHDNQIIGNFIGTNAAAIFRNTSSYTDAHGIHISQTATRNHVGGTALADRNVISGNGRSGVGIWDQGTDSNVVMNNIIGLAPGGDRRLGNLYHGVDMNFGVSYTVVGGTGPGERNLISANGRQGIEISHVGNTTFNRVIGNFVGTNANGTAGSFSTGNSGFGIQVKDRVANNVVSGNVVGNNRKAGIRVDEYGNCCVGHNEFTNNRVGIGVDGSAIPNSVAGFYVTAGNAQIGPGNIITNNPVGIRIEGNASDRNTITRNSIYDNTGLGIDLAPIGSVNRNDSGDGDSGANQQLNFPVLTSASLQQVTGTACAGCRVEVFVASSHSATYGEGQAFVGAATAAADRTFVVPISGAAAGDYVTATATDAQGNTSEFSLNLLVTASAAPVITSLSPNSARVGSGAFQMVVAGTNFAADAVVRWNGADRPTQFVNSRQLTADIPASDLARAGTASVTVFNRGAGLGSNVAPFGIGSSAPPPPVQRPRLYLPFARR